MKLRQVAVLALVVIPIAGCVRRTPPPAAAPPAAAAPAPVAAPNNDAANRARQDSIAAAELARRQGEERQRRAETARAQEILTTIVYFELDSDALTAATEEQLRTKASIMRANPSIELRVEGHADERGSTEYNIVLGDRRAEAVRTFMAGYGIMGDRISTISYGKERPAMEGSNEAAWARNRRAEFAVTAGEISAVPAEAR